MAERRAGLCSVGSVGMADPQLRLVLEDCVGKTFHNSVCSSIRRDLNDGPLGDKVRVRCEVDGMGTCDVGMLFVKCVCQLQPARAVALRLFTTYATVRSPTGRASASGDGASQIRIQYTETTRVAWCRFGGGRGETPKSQSLYGLRKWYDGQLKRATPAAVPHDDDTSDAGFSPAARNGTPLASHPHRVRTLLMRPTRRSGRPAS
jgi:hypothetical protein